MPKKAKKTRKDNANKPEYDEGKFTSARLPYHKNQVYFVPVKTKNVKYDDLVKYAKIRTRQIAKVFPDSYISFAVKYHSIGTAKSAGFTHIQDDPSIIIPYEYIDKDTEPIEYFFVSIAIPNTPANIKQLKNI